MLRVYTRLNSFSASANTFTFASASDIGDDRLDLPHPFITSHTPLAISHAIARSQPLLSPERASLCESSLATCRLAQHLRAAGADNDGLSVREDGGDGEAAGALDVHEEGSRAGDERLLYGLVGYSSCDAECRR